MGLVHGAWGWCMVHGAWCMGFGVPTVYVAERRGDSPIVAHARFATSRWVLRAALALSELFAQRSEGLMHRQP